MEFEIDIFPPMDTRPCLFCLSLREDSVFADFDVEDGRVYLVRISFDGFGCFRLEESKRKMNLDDSRSVLKMIDSKKVDRAELSKILSNYFRENVDVIWKDALIEHKLL